MQQSGLQFPQDFFEEEVRDGFYVPSAIKQAWGAQLEVLYEIDRICKKHNIPYFADWGTLLGAVRHGGFIPWDDDLDITMKREDYEYFMEVADTELPEGFATINYARHHDFWMFLGRVVNTRKACFEAEHLRKFHGFPYIAGVDIFVLDYVSPDVKKEELRVKKARYVIAAADEIAEGKVTGKKVEETLQSIEKFCQVKLERTEDLYQLRVQLYRLAEKLFAEFPEKECEELTRMMPNGLYGGGFRLPKEYYREAIELPFEHISIPVPIAYDEMLRRRYGDYMKLVRNMGGHDYPFFQIQKEHLQDVLDFKIPGYYFSKEELEEIPRSEEPSCKELATECRTELENLQQQLVEIFSVERQLLENVGLEGLSAEIQEELQRNRQQALQSLADSQQLAIDLGNLIGECKGEEHITIKYLEAYCEQLYHVYQQIVNGAGLENVIPEVQQEAEAGSILAGIQQLAEAVRQISQSIEKDILQRKEVVFLPYKASYWAGMASVYQAAIEDPDCDVYVIPMPYFYKDYDGALIDMQYEAEQFPEDVEIIKYDAFDFALHRPDMIFIQNPSDQYDDVLSVHSFFYSTNLKQYTDKLIYIPWFRLEEFTKENYREYANMQYYCTRPGVLHSDMTIVQSEQMRQLYIEKLTEFAGEETRAIWEKKILGLGSPLEDSQSLGLRLALADKKAFAELYGTQIPEEWKTMLQKSDGSNKKVILYYTSISSFCQYGQRMLEKMQSVFQTFQEHKDEVVMLWRADSLIEVVLKQTQPKLWEAYQNIQRQFVTENWGIYDDSADANRAVVLCDGYYGDASSIAHMCRQAEKPVMLQVV